MLKDRLKSIDLKITELSDYLQISRPTMYKFIEYYDNAEFELINKKVLKLFNYINDNELVGKKGVINYILSNLVEVKELHETIEMETIKNLKKIIISNQDSKKSQFLSIISKKDYFDEIINFLVEVEPLFAKKTLTLEEQKLLQKYEKIKKEIKKEE